MLKKSPSTILKALQQILNTSMLSEVFPIAWKHAIVAPIHKKGDFADKRHFDKLRLYPSGSSHNGGKHHRKDLLMGNCQRSCAEHSKMPNNNDLSKCKKTCYSIVTPSRQFRRLDRGLHRTTHSRSDHQLWPAMIWSGQNKQPKFANPLAIWSMYSTALAHH